MIRPAQRPLAGRTATRAPEVVLGQRYDGTRQVTLYAWDSRYTDPAMLDELARDAADAAYYLREATARDEAAEAAYLLGETPPRRTATRD